MSQKGDGTQSLAKETKGLLSAADHDSPFGAEWE